jgi:hypothetical protein
MRGRTAKSAKAARLSRSGVVRRVTNNVPAVQKLCDREIEGRTTQTHYSDLAVSNCTFVACYLPPRSVTGHWNTIRNVSLRDVAQINCTFNATATEDVSLHNLKRLGNAPLFFWGCVFRHVTLSGRISGIKINRLVSIVNARAKQDQKKWDQHVLKFYRSTDWALDISNANFLGGISFEALPGDKIRINPETQALVRRKRLLNSNWKALDYGRSAFDVGLTWFVEDSIFDSVVLAASMGGKQWKEELAVLAMLRNKGIADP